MSGHVDVCAEVAVPVEKVWAAANDPGVWAGAGHPVEDLSADGLRSVFRVVTPPDPAGRSFSYRVERIADPAARTVFSRRFDSDEFLYSHVWFAYRWINGKTEMRCVVDFEMRPGAALDDTEMTAVMTRGLARNLQQTARRIEGADREAPGDE
jgi:aromatase